MFVGTYQHTIDDKGRLTLPAKWRSELVGGVYLTRGLDKCIYVFTKGKFEAMASDIGGQGFERADARGWARHVGGKASDVEADRQGRIVVPLNLREYAGLDGDVVVVGVISHIEVWNPAAHKEAEERVEADVETIAERFGAMIHGSNGKAE